MERNLGAKAFRNSPYARVVSLYARVVSIAIAAMPTLQVAV
jgi:hypothetical protein